MASTARTRLNDVQSAPPPANISLFNVMETIPSASTECGILSGTQSLHTTPRDNGSSDALGLGVGHSVNVEVDPDSTSYCNEAAAEAAAQRVSSMVGLRISVGNVASTENQHSSHSHSARYSSRSSQRLKEHNSSRQAGHTPPPSAQSKAANLVQDTAAKEGPINWWNLRVKMPDDNTMHILSPHRIPVPRTPTTPSLGALSLSLSLFLFLFLSLSDLRECAMNRIHRQNARRSPCLSARRRRGR